SDADRNKWLERAVGQNLDLLNQARDEAHRAAELCPLQGETYMLLTQLAVLHGDDSRRLAALTEQALRVRPHNADVLFEIGREKLAANDLDGALDRWEQCYADAGPLQLKIVNLLAGRIP